MQFPARFSDEDLQEALRVVTAWLLNDVDAPFGFIADLGAVEAMSARRRSIMPAAERLYAHVDRAYNAGQAVVVASALMRGIITAVMWLSLPVYPLKVCAALAAAETFVEEQLRRGLSDYPHGPHWKRRRR
jgi:hypothetical protein